MYVTELHATSLLTPLPTWLCDKNPTSRSHLQPLIFNSPLFLTVFLCLAALRAGSFCMMTPPCGDKCGDAGTCSSCGVERVGGSSSSSSRRNKFTAAISLGSLERYLCNVLIYVLGFWGRSQLNTLAIYWLVTAFYALHYL